MKDSREGEKNRGRGLPKSGIFDVWQESNNLWNVRGEPRLYNSSTILLLMNSFVAESDKFNRGPQTHYLTLNVHAHKTPCKLTSW